MTLLEQELSTRLVPQPGNSAPVDHFRRVNLHFILQEHQGSPSSLCNVWTGSKSSLRLLLQSSTGKAEEAK